MDISFKNVSYIYGETPFEKLALDNVSFEIKKGDLLG